MPIDVHVIKLLQREKNNTSFIEIIVSNPATLLNNDMQNSMADVLCIGKMPHF